MLETVTPMTARNAKHKRNDVGIAKPTSRAGRVPSAARTTIITSATADDDVSCQSAEDCVGAPSLSLTRLHEEDLTCAPFRDPLITQQDVLCLAASDEVASVAAEDQVSVLTAMQRVLVAGFGLSGRHTCRVQLCLA